MDFETIVDLLQCASLMGVIVLYLNCRNRLNELEDDAAQVGITLIKTRLELDLPAFPTDPKEEDKT